RHTAVVLEAAAIEDHRGDPGRLGALADELADVLRGVDGRGRARAQLGFHRRRADHGAAATVVDGLYVDVLVRPEHRQARTLGRAHDLLPDTAVAPRAVFRLAERHIRLFTSGSTPCSTPLRSLRCRLPYFED